MQAASMHPAKVYRGLSSQPLPWLVVSAGTLLMLGVVLISSASMDTSAANLGN